MLRIVQAQGYMGHDWWRWSVWIEGPAAELDDVKQVVWHLHPTFVPSEVARANQAEGFRLDSAGWGGFLLTAVLRLRSGGTKRLQHELELFYPDEKPVETLGPPDVEAFVHSQILPPVRSRSRGEARLQESVEGAASLMVVRRQLAAFDDTIPHPIRPTLCRGLLLANLVADRQTQDEDNAAGWFSAYREVLARLGHTIESAGVSDVSTGSGTSELCRALVPPLTASLKARRAGAMVLDLLAKMGNADIDTPWFELLEREAHGGGRSIAGLGFTALDGDSTGGAHVTAVFVAVKAPHHPGTPLLLTPVAAHTRLHLAAVEASIGATVIAATRDALAAKLAPFVADQIQAVTAEN